MHVNFLHAETMTAEIPKQEGITCNI